MAKIAIAGSSYIITSMVSMADFEMIKKYRPSVLALVDAETKETLFRVGIGSDSISDYGISFGGVSNNETKLATATLSIPYDVEDARAYVLDKAGLVLANLNKVEAGITNALEEIRVERDTVANSISVIV